MLKSRKAQMALIAIILEFIIFSIPDLEANRAALGLLVASIVAMLMGTHALTDIAAINKGVDRS